MLNNFLIYTQNYNTILLHNRSYNNLYFYFRIEEIKRLPFYILYDTFNEYTLYAISFSQKFVINGRLEILTYIYMRIIKLLVSIILS